MFRPKAVHAHRQKGNGRWPDNYAYAWVSGRCRTRIEDFSDDELVEICEWFSKDGFTGWRRSVGQACNGLRAGKKCLGLASPKECI